MITKSHTATEEMMMDAVCTAVDSWGFENFTTKVWAKTANISEGSLYYHFKNKEDLLEKTFIRVDKLFVNELKNIFADNVNTSSVKDMANQILDAYLIFLCSHPIELRFYRVFSKTKLYKANASSEQMKDWSRMSEILLSYRLEKKEILTEIQFFFTEPVAAYAEHLCSFDTNTPDENFEYIGQLLKLILTYILNEKVTD